MPVTPPSFTAYDQKLDDLARKQQEQFEAEGLKVAAAKLTPPERSAFITYTSPQTGQTHETTLVFRLLTQDELIGAARMAATFAGGVNINALPQEAADICHAWGYVSTMWGRDLPAWLKEALAFDESALLDLYYAAVEHRQAYFRGNPGKGGEDTPKRGLVIHKERPAGPAGV